MMTAAIENRAVSGEIRRFQLRLASTPNEALPDLRDPGLYLNRELTWLAFNRRVLHEAQDPRTPILERVKFLAIVSSNLDEFFMKRIGGLKQQVGAGIESCTVDGRTPRQQIVACVAEVRSILGEKAAIGETVFRALKAQGIGALHWRDLTNAEQATLRDDYQRRVLPLVTPLGFDRAHPFPFLSNLSLNLLVTLREREDGESSFVRVKVPVGPQVSRFVWVGDTRSFVLLEEVIAHNLDLLFADRTVESCHMFRVTRNASTDRNEETADDLLAMIEAEVRDRKFAPLVRLETGEAMPTALRDLLVVELGLDPETDVFADRGLPGMADLMELAELDLPALRDPPHQPIDTVALSGGATIFDSIRAHGSILLQHPYESFTHSVERFLDQASLDEQVLAIKATLYRTSPGTRIISSLEAAARAGKQVAVTIELKARFDEEANVRWARRLEDAGVHVSYGLMGFKTHCKAILVVRSEGEGLCRYTHVGTGNYHAGTARGYADVGLLSCDEELGHDIADLFNTLTSGRNLDRRYRKILTAPKSMKQALLGKIEREIALHSAESPGRIRLKTNALEDPDVVEALYRAGRAGIRVDLLVRDTCRLRPGLSGLSESITVISTVGRFLEHSRIYAFGNGGAEEYFIGSADLMQRNLEHRIELLVPVESAEARAALDQILNIHLADQRQAWVMQSDGHYVQRQPSEGEEARGCQELQVDLAKQRRQAAGPMQDRSVRPHGPSARQGGIESKQSTKQNIKRGAAEKAGPKPSRRSNPKPDAKPKRRRRRKEVSKPAKARRDRSATGNDLTLVASKRKAVREVDEKDNKNVLGKSRGIDSMLRNAYRAQLAMIALAARKANIMISINGFLLSLLTISSAYVLTSEPLLLVPFALFLLTCIMAILFAVLAARPQHVNKRATQLADFRADRADLLVFEQFANLSRTDYMDAMLELMQDNKRVYQAMISHIHFLGKSAQRRFGLLQISYSAFIIGLAASCVSLIVVAARHYL